jgi:hypothetical protein
MRSRGGQREIFASGGARQGLQEFDVLKLAFRKEIVPHVVAKMAAKVLAMDLLAAALPPRRLGLLM